MKNNAYTAWQNGLVANLGLAWDRRALRAGPLGQDVMRSYLASPQLLEPSWWVMIFLACQLQVKFAWTKLSLQVRRLKRKRQGARTNWEWLVELCLGSTGLDGWLVSSWSERESSVFKGVTVYSVHIPCSRPCALVAACRSIIHSESCFLASLFLESMLW